MNDPTSEVFCSVEGRAEPWESYGHILEMTSLRFLQALVSSIQRLCGALSQRLCGAAAYRGLPSFDASPSAFHPLMHPSVTSIL
jgi:hypothetical protein